MTRFYLVPLNARSWMLWPRGDNLSWHGSKSQDRLGAVSLCLASFPSILRDRGIKYKVKEDLWRNRMGTIKIRIQCTDAALKAVDFWTVVSGSQRLTWY